MKISGKTRICGLIGNPISHTLSPAMHNAAFQKLKLDFVYVPFKVEEAELRDAIKGLKSVGVVGLNVTMPYKSSVLKYLDELDSTTSCIGAVNTILNEEGKLRGYNTDGVGALRALKESGVNLSGKKLVLLGAGGAGKAIAFHAAREVSELVILNRTPGKAGKLAAELIRKFGDKGITGQKLSTKILREELKDADILVNATSVGMHPNADQSPVPESLMKQDLVVMDIVYNPFETKLLSCAKQVGAKAVHGIEMLVHQGAASFEIWTKHAAPVEVMRQAAFEMLYEVGTSR